MPSRAPRTALGAALVQYFSASCAATVSESLTYPLDLLKTRLQLQHERGVRPADGGAPRRMTALLRHVVATEGPRALFAGCTIAIVRQWVNAGVSVGLYPSVRAALLGDGEDAASAPLWKRAAAGAVTGVVAQALAQPTDIVKVRLQADGRLRAAGGVPRYAGVADAFAGIVRAEGVRGLYVALGSSVWRAGILNAVGIASYDHTKQWATRAVGGDVAPQAIAAGVCGVISAVISCPLDVVKTRVINSPTLYAGPNDALMQLVRKEGVLALFKGLLPTYQRQAVWNGVFWLLLEEFQKATGSVRL